MPPRGRRGWPLHHDDPNGVWLVLAKKGDDADQPDLRAGARRGAVPRLDRRPGPPTRRAPFQQRFTPRRARSTWLEANVGHVERGSGEGRMHPAGVARRRARQGRRALGGPRTPARRASRCRRPRQAHWRASRGRRRCSRSSPARIATPFCIGSYRQAREHARARIEQFVAMLARGETVYPQRRGRGA